MCSTLPPGPSFIEMANRRLGLEPIVNRDPGDETDALDMPSDDLIFVYDEAALIPDRPSTAPHAADIEALYARTDRIQGSLARLALAVVELRAKPSRLQRLKALLGLGGR